MLVYRYSVMQKKKIWSSHTHSKYQIPNVRFLYITCTSKYFNFNTPLDYCVSHIDGEQFNLWQCVVYANAADVRKLFLIDFGTYSNKTILVYDREMEVGWEYVELQHYILWDLISIFPPSIEFRWQTLLQIPFEREYCSWFMRAIIQMATKSPIHWRWDPVPWHNISLNNQTKQKSIIRILSTPYRSNALKQLWLDFAMTQFSNSHCDIVIIAPKTTYAMMRVTYTHTIGRFYAPIRRLAAYAMRMKLCK